MLDDVVFRIVSIIIFAMNLDKLINLARLNV